MFSSHKKPELKFIVFVEVKIFFVFLAHFTEYAKCFYALILEQIKAVILIISHGKVHLVHDNETLGINSRLTCRGGESDREPGQRTSFEIFGFFRNLLN